MSSSKRSMRSTAADSRERGMGPSSVSGRALPASRGLTERMLRAFGSVASDGAYAVALRPQPARIGLEKVGLHGKGTSLHPSS